MLNENGKLQLSFAEDNKLALMKNYFCPPKSFVSYTFHSVNYSKGQVRLDDIPTKQTNRRLIRRVHIRRLPSEAPESDHKNIVYAQECFYDSPPHAGDGFKTNSASFFPHSFFFAGPPCSCGLYCKYLIPGERGPACNQIRQSPSGRGEGGTAVRPSRKGGVKNPPLVIYSVC